MLYLENKDCFIHWEWNNKAIFGEAYTAVSIGNFVSLMAGISSKV